MKQLLGGLLIAGTICIIPIAHAAVQYAESKPLVEREFTCWYMETEFAGTGQERHLHKSFEVTATTDTALRECMMKHQERKKQANSTVRRT